MKKKKKYQEGGAEVTPFSVDDQIIDYNKFLSPESMDMLEYYRTGGVVKSYQSGGGELDGNAVMPYVSFNGDYHDFEKNQQPGKSNTNSRGIMLGEGGDNPRLAQNEETRTFVPTDKLSEITGIADAMQFAQAGGMEEMIMQMGGPEAMAMAGPPQQGMPQQQGMPVQNAPQQPVGQPQDKSAVILGDKIEPESGKEYQELANKLKKIAKNDPNNTRVQDEIKEKMEQLALKQEAQRVMEEQFPDGPPQEAAPEQAQALNENMAMMQMLQGQGGGMQQPQMQQAPTPEQAMDPEAIPLAQAGMPFEEGAPYATPSANAPFESELSPSELERLLQRGNLDEYSVDFISNLLGQPGMEKYLNQESEIAYNDLLRLAEVTDNSNLLTTYGLNPGQDLTNYNPYPEAGLPRYSGNRPFATRTDYDVLPDVGNPLGTNPTTPMATKPFPGIDVVTDKAALKGPVEVDLPKDPTGEKDAGSKDKNRDGKPDYLGMATLAGAGIASNIGNIMYLANEGKRADQVDPERYTVDPELISLDQQRRDIETRMNRVAYENRMRGRGDITREAFLAGQELQQMAPTYEKEQNVNAQIINSADQFNAQMRMNADDINAQNKAAAQKQYYDSISQIGQNINNLAIDINQRRENKQMYKLLDGYFPHYSLVDGQWVFTGDQSQGK